MAAGKIRTRKPELLALEAYAGLTDGAARLFDALPTLADDSGRCPAAPSFLVGQVFWARQRSANVIGQLLTELEAADLIKRYTAKGGSFLEIVGWSDKGHVNYQYIKKPHPQRYPAPPWNPTSAATSTATSAEEVAEQEQEQEQRTRPGTGSRSLVTELLAALPPGPNSLTLSVCGSAATAIEEALETGTSIEQCRKSIVKCFAFIAKHEIDISDEDHLENYVAKWIGREGKKRPGKSNTAPTEASTANVDVADDEPDDGDRAQLHPPLLGDVIPNGPWLVRDQTDGDHVHVFDGAKYVGLRGSRDPDVLARFQDHVRFDVPTSWGTLSAYRPRAERRGQP
jgi:hypothetical protein